MSFFRKVWSLFIAKPTPTAQKSVKLLIIHNLDLNEVEMMNLKSHLAVEIEEFLCAKIAQENIQPIELKHKQRA